MSPRWGLLRNIFSNKKTGLIIEENQYKTDTQTIRSMDHRPRTMYYFQS
ncbi:hypothetical protein BH24BAC1_BH24BAC1_40960 [soil metagenome]